MLGMLKVLQVDVQLDLVGHTLTMAQMQTVMRMQTIMLMKLWMQLLV